MNDRQHIEHLSIIMTEINNRLTTLENRLNGLARRSERAQDIGRELESHQRQIASLSEITTAMSYRLHSPANGHESSTSERPKRVGELQSC